MESSFLFSYRTLVLCGSGLLVKLAIRVEVVTLSLVSGFVRRIVHIRNCSIFPRIRNSVR